MSDMKDVHFENKLMYFDAIGNEIKLKDLVTYNQAGPLVGRIVEIKEGSVVSTPQGPQGRPAIVRVLIDCNVSCFPGLPCAILVKVQDPTTQTSLVTPS